MSEEITPALTAEEWAAPERFGVPVRPHATAALCLYGQPFGFTQEDVEAVHFAADYMEGEDHMRKEDADRARVVADRIAALLPPEQLRSSEAATPPNPLVLPPENVK